MAKFLTGDRELDLAFRRLEGKPARKVVAKGVRAGMRVFVKAIKSEIPSHMKDAKKAIRSRFLRSKKTGDSIRAKVGAAVGMKKAKQKAAAEAALATHSQGKGTGKKPGVGLGPRSVKWLLMGTKSRTQETTGRRTGIMPKIGAVKRGFAKSEAAATKKIVDTIRKGILREFKK